jgi:nucleotide-binding universal stress UspA family protein
MGRDHNLTEHFARIHPRRHTPYVAVVASGTLMILLAWGMQETETVASAADIMFLLLFLQVNVALMTLRHKMPEIDRGFIVPLFPWVPLIGIFSNLALTIFLFIFKPVAALVILVWIVAGLLTYFAYFSRKEALEKPTDILHEEVLVSRRYSVLVPVSSHEQARILGQFGALIAADHDGEVLALHVAKVPPQLSLADGRYFRKEGREYLETVIDQARMRDVPVHTMIRLSRKVPDAVGRTSQENASNLIVLGWPGRTSSASRMFGNVIDPIVDNPPTDIALVRYHEKQRPVRSVLVAVAGGLNSRHAARLAISIARQVNKLPLGFADQEGDSTPEPLSEPVHVELVHVLPAGSTEALRVRGEKALAYAQNGANYPHISRRIIGATSALEALRREAEKHDLIVIGASEEPLFRNMMFGNLAEELAREAPVSVIVVKRRSGPIHRFLRQTVLEPTTGEPLVRNGRNNKTQQEEAQEESEAHQTG